MERKLFNVLFLLSGIAVSVSGSIIQLHYHLQMNPAESPVFALGRAAWNNVHTGTAVLFLLAVVYHVRAHRKWYAYASKHPAAAKYSPTLLLTVLTFVVVVSGLIPLFVHYCGGNPALRFSVIEVHDKTALLFLIVAFRHTIKRFKPAFRH